MSEITENESEYNNNDSTVVQDKKINEPPRFTEMLDYDPDKD